MLRFADEIDLEIIVVDNCSTDGSSETIRAAFPETLVIDSPINGGFAYGNAIGFEQASGRFILLINPDTQIHESCLQNCLEGMLNHPELGAIGPKVLLEDGSKQSSMMRFLRLKHFFFFI